MLGFGVRVSGSCRFRVRFRVMDRFRLTISDCHKVKLSLRVRVRCIGSVRFRGRYRFRVRFMIRVRVRIRVSIRVNIRVRVIGSCKNTVGLGLGLVVA